MSGVLQLLEWWLLGVSPGAAAIVIYLHMAAVGTVLLSTFWSMLNEEFDPREAKSKFGRIAAAGTVGGLAGGILAERTVAWSGAPSLMLELAALHLACAGFLALLFRRCAATVQPADAATQTPITRPRSSLLTTVGGIVLLGSIGAALLDFVFKVYATESWGGGAGLLRFFAFFHTGVALWSFLMQSTVAKVILQKFGIGKSILTLPATLAGEAFWRWLPPALRWQPWHGPPKPPPRVACSALPTKPATRLCPPERNARPRPSSMSGQRRAEMRSEPRSCTCACNSRMVRPYRGYSALRRCWGFLPCSSADPWIGSISKPWPGVWNRGRSN